MGLAFKEAKKLRESGGSRKTRRKRMRWKKRLKVKRRNNCVGGRGRKDEKKERKRDRYKNLKTISVAKFPYAFLRKKVHLLCNMQTNISHLVV